MSDYAAGKADWAAMGLPMEGREAEEPRLGGLAQSGVPTAGLSDAVEGVRDRLEEDGWTTAVVVSGDQVVLGRAYASDLEDVDPGAPIEQAMTSGPSTFRPNVTAREMLRFMERHDLETALVTTSDGRLVGMVRKEDLEEAV